MKTFFHEVGVLCRRHAGHKHKNLVVNITHSNKSTIQIKHLPKLEILSNIDCKLLQSLSTSQTISDNVPRFH